MSMSEPSPPAATSRRFRWRRLLQYRLRTLLILMTVIAVWLAWWSHKARRQREAVAALTTLSAKIVYDDYTYGSPPLLLVRTRPYLPKWLVKLLGKDYFANVISVSLPTEVSDADLAPLRGLADLEELDLGRTRITEAGLEHLKKLTTLKELRLGSSKYTDSLGEFWGGQSGPRITDAGLQHLRHLAHLEVLDLDGTPVTDWGLQHLKELKSLRRLYLIETEVTDEGVARLRQSLPNCKIVYGTDGKIKGN
jgi:hypothetical protein